MAKDLRSHLGEQATGVETSRVPIEVFLPP